MKAQKINRISLWLLGVGWGTALVVYLTTEPPQLDPLLGDPMMNKKYVHELRVMGGAAAVASAEFTAWFEDLWRGQNLAGTLAVLTAGMTIGFRFVAARPGLFAPTREESQATGESSGPTPPDARR